jgi:hypothetical protein
MLSSEREDMKTHQVTGHNEGEQVFLNPSLCDWEALRWLWHLLHKISDGLLLSTAMQIISE